MNNQQNPFMDNKGLMAVVIIGVFFFFWQSYMAKTYPPKPATTATTPADQTAAQAPGATNTSATTAATEVTSGQDNKATNINVQEKLISYEGEKLKFSVSNVGMGLKNVTLKDYTDRKGQLIQLGLSDQASLFEMRITKTGAPVIFN